MKNTVNKTVNKTVDKAVNKTSSKTVLPGVTLREPEDKNVDRALWEFGQILRARREQLKLTVKYAAYAAGIHPAFLYRLERGGVYRFCGGSQTSLENLYKLLDILALPRSLADKATFMWAMHRLKGDVRGRFFEILEDRGGAPNSKKQAKQTPEVSENQIPVLQFSELTKSLADIKQSVSIPGLIGTSLRAFKIEDEKMAPEIPSGALVIFDFDSQPKNGELALCLISGKVSARRYFERDTRIVLKCANPSYPQEIYALDQNESESDAGLETEPEILGRIIYLITPIN